jgi:two-component system, sensor histidine kinase YesM
MEWIHSVRIKIVLGFALVVTPLVFYLFYNNYYAINVVREQVAQNYDGLLQQYALNTDNMLNETSLYLYRFVNDPDFTTLYAYGTNSSDYYLTKIRIFNKLNSGIGYYTVISSMFVFSPTYHELLLASAEQYSTEYEEINRILPELKKQAGAQDERWFRVQLSDGQAMVKLANVSTDLVAGVWIRTDKLVDPLRAWNLGDGDAALVDDQGKVLTGTRIQSPLWGQYDVSATTAGRNYHLIDDSYSKERYLLVRSASSITPLRYMLAVPESTILKQLPYFQRALLIIPFVVLIVLIVYFFFLQRIFIGPLSALIRGMRRIGQGNLNVRLKASKKGEFAFLNSTFNDMVSQIRSLTIHVYEEKLRVQQVEYRHLQVQINPHFFMNSLNIIYNLAVLKDYRMVQKMALHLADYFRFTIRISTSQVSLAEELKHITNYLEIQTLRYPDNLQYEITLPKEFESFSIPPLTIQPFVENSILHGFKKRQEPFRIYILVEEDPLDPGEYMRITVQDSGVGFSEEWLREYSHADWRQMQGEHIGIWNVLRRLDIAYEGNASVALDNDDGGAKVVIRLPLQTKMGGAGEEGEMRDV